MNPELKQLLNSIPVQTEGKGNDRYCVATCPECGYTHSVDVRHSEPGAQAMARAHVANHMQKEHGGQATADAT